MTLIRVAFHAVCSTKRSQKCDQQFLSARIFLLAVGFRKDPGLNYPPENCESFMYTVHKVSYNIVYGMAQFLWLLGKLPINCHYVI